MHITLFDDNKRKHLLPFVFTRPCAQLRIGIFTIKEKWEQALNATTSFSTEPYLKDKYPEQAYNIKINGRLLPNTDLVAQLSKLRSGSLVTPEHDLIAEHQNPGPQVVWNGTACFINRPYDIFVLNSQEIAADLETIQSQRTSQPLPTTVQQSGSHSIFIEEGAIIGFCTLNTEDGPIYIGKNATIMDGCNIRGSFAIGSHSTLKMGAKIYGGTTIGPHSKVGGEVNNSVIQGYSNKGHDGFLGNSVIGEWCNLGADSNNSNLKNNYDEVRLWDYQTNRFEPSGKQFCGLIMGDHSKCGINTMFNTGTVVGVSANIFGGGFPRNFIPSFSWGGHAGFTTYKLKKALETGKRVMDRRNIELDEVEENILEHIYKETEGYRTWEN